MKYLRRCVCSQHSTTTTYSLLPQAGHQYMAKEYYEHSKYAWYEINSQINATGRRLKQPDPRDA